MKYAMDFISLSMFIQSGDFESPSLYDFFPPVIFTVFGLEVNRLVLIRFIALIALLLLFWLGTRKMKVVPGRFQNFIEMALRIPRVTIAEEVLGSKDAKRFVPIITSIFFTVFFMNITGIVPLLNLAGTSAVALPMVLATVSYVTFIYAGLKKSPKKFLKNSFFPSGVPKVIYLIVTPIEFISTFILRPVTLTLRLLMNMVVGHMLLALFFSAAWFFFFSLGSWWSAFGAGSLLFGFIFTLFEGLVAFLQAYVFALLTAVYIQLAVANEH